MVTETPKIEEVIGSRPKLESEDLSRAIAQAVERQRGEDVRCIRVYGQHYRCNWWVKDDDDGVGSKIRKSRFLRATRTPDGLVIDDLTR